MRRVILAAAVAGVLGPPAVAHSDEDIGKAEHAFADLRYEEAKFLVDRARRRGQLSRAELLEGLVLEAKIASITEGAAAGARAFRHVLTLEPTFRLDSSASPVFREPLNDARGWLEIHGALEVRHPTPSYDAGSAHLKLRVFIERDPLATASAAEATLGFPRKTIHAPIANGEAGMTVALEPDQRTGMYWLAIRDRNGNQIRSLGTPEAPLRFDVSAPPLSASPRETGARGGWSLGNKWLLGAAVTGGALLLGAIAFDVAATSEFAALDRSCAPSCTRSELSTFRSRRRNSLLFYGGAAAAGSATVVLWAWD